MGFKFKYLTVETIESDAEAILGQAGFGNTLPVEIELLLESTFEYSVVYDESLPYGVDGAIELGRKQIRISTRVDHIGRQRFTLAHELGHLVLHIPHIEDYRLQAPLFEEVEIPAILQDPSAEWQADVFASAILMPKRQMTLRYGELVNRGVWVDPRRVADDFLVSVKAAELRLEALGMSRKSNPGQKLYL